MSPRCYELHSVRVLECAPAGAPLRTDRDAVELLNQAWNHRASLIAIPAELLSEDFFELKTRIAGEILHRFVIYHMRVAIVGDISPHVAESTSLRDFVYESNRGDQVWFVQSIDALAARLQALESRQA